MKKINYLSLSTVLIAGVFTTACSQQQTQTDPGMIGAASQQTMDHQIPAKVVPQPVVQPIQIHKPMVKPKQVLKVRPMVKPKQVLKTRPM